MSQSPTDASRSDHPAGADQTAGSDPADQAAGPDQADQPVRPGAGTAFDSLDDYIALPRVEGLVLSPDGRRAVLTVATLNAEGTGYDRALWQVAAHPSPDDRPVRLTRSAKGESSAAFTADGDLLFVSARPDGSGDDDTPAQLWMLPAAGGEARPVTRLSGGVSGIAAVATASDRVIVTAGLLPSATGVDDDARLRRERTTTKTKAILHEGYPVRFWDHDLGPDEQHLLALTLGELREPVGVERKDAAAGTADAAGTAAAVDVADADPANADPATTGPAPYPAHLPVLHDLTPHPGRPEAVEAAAITPDGRTVVAAMVVPDGFDTRARLVAIDVESGAHTVLRDEPGVDLSAPCISHDGRMLAFVRTPLGDPSGPADEEIFVAAIDGADARRVAADWDHWPASLAFSAADDALIVVADQDGRAPVFRIPLDGSAPEQLTHDDVAYASIRVDATGTALVGLRSSWMAPAHPVRIDGGAVTPLATPAPPPEVPAELAEVETTASDGTRVRGWLLTPPGASAATPAPLLLWIHGGPLSSWNAWSWRWNPQLAVAHGYAVLLPDPALSTGYGLHHIARGWNAWGAAPFTDLMAITDAVVARDAIDATRTAAMGGSFGGYMANWVAGHTDRFRAIVTHASLWALDQFAGTTDHSGYWKRIFTPKAMVENSPHRFLDRISTPMLVVHGDRDYRVPLGEGLRLWSELNERFARTDGTLDHKFLYFPDENHWVLKPQHARVWYETVFAFLDHHVRGDDWVRPQRLG